MDRVAVFAITVALSVLASLLIPSHSGWRGHLLNAIRSATFGTILVTLFYLLLTVQTVDRHLAYQEFSNPYARARRQMAEVSSRAPLVDARRRKLASIEKDLELLSKGTVTLTSGAEVVAEWLEGIRSAKKEILATNIVRPGVWEKNAEMRGPGREVQKAAIQSDSPVTIRRIWLYSAVDEPSHQSLLAVSLDQKSFGVQVRYLTTEELFAAPFVTPYLQQLDSVDIVIYDGATILVTSTDPADFSILNGYVTTDSECIQAGRDLFDRLWSIAKPHFYR